MQRWRSASRAASASTTSVRPSPNATPSARWPARCGGTRRHVKMTRRMELGYARTELRRELVDAVLSRAKTATASLRDDYQPVGDEPLPKVGERSALLDFDDVPVG